jgi:DNA-binding response OmpR family regulator
MKALIAVALGFSLLGNAATAQGPTGASLFVTHGATCHSAEGEGGGRPADACSLIDDERPVAEATSLLLEIEGFEVSVASSAKEALLYLRAFSPDVIVIDYHLRGCETGDCVVAEVRAQLRTFVPVIFVTGDTARSALSTSRIANALLLNKPVHADDLLGAVRDQIRSFRAAAASAA